MALERGLLRPMIGEPPFAVLMLTIGLGFVIRAVAGAIWGNQPRAIDSPFAGEVIEVSGLIIGYENIAIVAGTALLCALLYLFFRFTRIGLAMQAASQNQLAAFYLGIPVKRVSALGHIRRHRRAAGILWRRYRSSTRSWAGRPSRPLRRPSGGSAAFPRHRRRSHHRIVNSCGPLSAPGLSEVSAFVYLLAMFLRPQGIFATLQQKKV